MTYNEAYASVAYLNDIHKRYVELFNGSDISKHSLVYEYYYNTWTTGYKIVTQPIDENKNIFIKLVLHRLQTYPNIQAGFYTIMV